MIVLQRGKGRGQRSGIRENSGAWRAIRNSHEFRYES